MSNVSVMTTPYPLPYVISIDDMTYLGAATEDTHCAVLYTFEMI
jgi:hypothetical protein